MGGGGLCSCKVGGGDLWPFKVEEGGGGMSQMGIKTNSGQLVSVGSLLIVIPNDQQGILRPCSIRYPYAGPSQLTQRINQ